VNVAQDNYIESLLAHEPWPLAGRGSSSSSPVDHRQAQAAAPLPPPRPSPSPSWSSSAAALAKSVSPWGGGDTAAVSTSAQVRQRAAEQPRGGSYAV
jgi:hypothetical protein